MPRSKIPIAIFYDTNVLLGYVFEWDDWNYPSSIAFDDERKKYWSKTVHKEFNDKFKEFSEEAKRFLNELKFRLKNHNAQLTEEELEKFAKRKTEKRKIINNKKK